MMSVEPSTTKVLHSDVDVVTIRAPPYMSPPRSPSLASFFVISKIEL